MKPLLQLLGNLVFAVSTVVGLFLVAAHFVGPKPEPHRFHSVYAAGLWTREPTRIDPETQNLERVPGPVVQQPAAAKPVRNPRVMRNEVASLDPAAGTDALVTGAVERSPLSTDPLNNVMLSAHMEWCSQRYRSFDAASNSYRSFSGRMKTCQSPYSTMPERVVSGAPAMEETAAVDIRQPAPGDDHVQSCMRRYRSYNMADNTYQPFGGGPRRQCR
jgi:hypothetical protein